MASSEGREREGRGEAKKDFFIDFNGGNVIFFLR